jgi:hypothetical protein
MPAHIAVQSTPTPESVHAIFGDEVRIRLVLHETADGALSLGLEMTEGEGQGLGIAALAFDFADHNLLGQLSLAGTHLRKQSFGAGKVHGVGRGGRGHDCGARLGRATAIGVAAPRETRLTLAHDRMALTLDDLANCAFSLQLVPTAANHVRCESFIIEGRFPTRPASGRTAGTSADGSVFGGMLDEILPLMSRLTGRRSNAA